MARAARGIHAESTRREFVARLVLAIAAFLPAMFPSPRQDPMAALEAE